MMELTELIKGRRTVYNFEDRIVDPALVTELLETAIWVPNYHMTQPWRFILVQGEGRRKIAKAGRLHREQQEDSLERRKEAGQKAYDKFMATPLFLVVLMKENFHPVIREEDYASMSCIIQNFSLLAWEKGLGVLWDTDPLMYNPGFRQTLGIKPCEKVVGNLHLGYPAQIPFVKARTPINHLVTVFDQE